MANKYVKSFNFGGDTLYPLPIVTSEQNGKVLKVVDGVWSPANMIPENTGPSFTIDGQKFYFDSGMTWHEWIVSDYNTIGLIEVPIDFLPNVYEIYDADESHILCDNDSISVKSIEEIIENEAYALQ